MRDARVQGQGRAQAPMRSGKVGERLEDDDPLAHPLAIFTEAGGLADERGERLSHGQVESLDERRADREAKLCEPFGSEHSTARDGLEPPLLLLFDQLSVHQRWMRRGDWLARPTALPRAREGRDRVEARDQGCQVTGEPVTEERGHAAHARFGRRDDFGGGCKRARPNDGDEHQPELRGEADPDPLPSVCVGVPTLARGGAVAGVLALDEVPHLVELNLCDRQVAQQMRVDLFRLKGSATQPLEYGFLRDTEHEGDARQIDAHQEHLQGQDDALLWGTQVEEGRIAGFREARPAGLAPKDAARAALREIRGESAHVATLPSALMSALGIGARLAPVFGGSHGSILRVV